MDDQRWISHVPEFVRDQVIICVCVCVCVCVWECAFRSCPGICEGSGDMYICVCVCVCVCVFFWCEGRIGHVPEFVRDQVVYVCMYIYIYIYIYLCVCVCL